MNISSITNYILRTFTKLLSLIRSSSIGKNPECNLDTEIDGKIESYFPGGKSTN
jgi:hypothetical protein